MYKQDLALNGRYAKSDQANKSLHGVLAGKIIISHSEIVVILSSLS